MLTKIYLAVLAASVAILGFFTYYAWSWLQSIGLPSAAAEGYAYHAALGWITLWISSLLLLLLGTAVLWSTRSSWGIWIAFLFFTVFTVIQSFWLGSAFNSFKEVNGMPNPAVSAIPILAALSIIGMAALAFFDQFVVIRLHRRTFPPDESDKAIVEDPGDVAVEQ